jgi:hypothetical protein
MIEAVFHLFPSTFQRPPVAEAQGVMRRTKHQASVTSGRHLSFQARARRRTSSLKLMTCPLHVPEAALDLHSTSGSGGMISG